MPDIDNAVTQPEGQEPGAGNVEEPAEQDQSTEDQAPQDAGTEEVAEQESALWAGIPEDHPVRNEVASLRREAAAKRTSAQQVKDENEQLQQKLAEAKTPEEVQGLIQEWQQKVSQAESQAARERVGRRHSLPDELVELLKGETEEKLDEHAQTLKGLFGQRNISPPPVPPTGGKHPAQGASSVEANLAAIKAARH